jgi:hypothetical protein
MKIRRSRLIQSIHKFGIKIRKSKESIFNTNTINKYISSEFKIRKIVVNVYTYEESKKVTNSRVNNKYNYNLESFTRWALISSLSLLSIPAEVLIKKLMKCEWACSPMVGRSTGTLPTRVQILVLAPFPGFIPGFSGVCVKW